MAKTREQLRDNLNTYTGDAANVIWTVEQKSLAINLAIQDAWPEIKKLTRTQLTLAAGSYAYVVTAMTRAPWGPAQVWIATTATATPVYRELRRSVLCRSDGASYSLEFDSDLVDNRDGYRIEVHYEQEWPELGGDAAVSYVPEAFVSPMALFHLCTMESMSGHHSDVETFRRLRPDFFEEAERARARNRIEALPRTLKTRWE